jgi:hypothetical protein
MSTKKPLPSGQSGKPGPADQELPEHTSTVAYLHQRSMGVTAKEKILLPFVFLFVGALLVVVGLVVRDHVSRGYTPVASLKAVVARAEKPPPQPGALSGLINPDDSRFVRVSFRNWQFWAGKGAIVQDHYIRIPDLTAPSIEALVKGAKGGAAAIALELDVGSREGHRYRLDRILRGGMPTLETNLVMEIYPLRFGTRPAISTTGVDASYLQSDGFVYDREQTWKGVSRFAATGMLQQRENGFRIQCSRFSVALGADVEPGLTAFMSDMAGTRLSEDLTFFLELEEVFPWKADGEPGRRQETGEIGSARVKGVLVGKLFILN